MVTDVRRVVDTLRGFHDLTGRAILSVGAGGGQFLDVYRGASKILAVDSDSAALRQLEAAVSTQGLQAKVVLVQGDFFEVATPAEVVVFEFSLHEMPDPGRALVRARSLAPEVVVFDHAPGSEWTYHTVEEDKVHRSREAMERCRIKRRAVFEGEQRFKDYDELRNKVASQGPTAIDRIARFQGRRDIVIPMGYMAVLL
jgi:hypothetical protein